MGILNLWLERISVLPSPAEICKRTSCVYVVQVYYRTITFWYLSKRSDVALESWLNRLANTASVSPRVFFEPQICAVVAYVFTIHKVCNSRK